MTILSGKLVLITGANRGIGYEVARKVINGGGRVLLAVRDLDAGNKAASELAPSGRADACSVLQLDTSSSSSIQSFVDAVRAKGQPIDVLVNNAGMYPDQWTLEAFNECVQVNYHTPVQLTLGLAPQLAEGGCVVMVSSAFGQLAGITDVNYKQQVAGASSLEEIAKISFDPDHPPTDHVPAYKLSKAMLNRATQLLAKDKVLTERSIAINAVCPGWCRTRMGGDQAVRTPEEGADSVMWAVTHGQYPAVTGGFYDKGAPLEW